jgi:hypothetical protein
MNGKMSFYLQIIENADFRDPYTHKTLYTSLVRPNLEHAACVWSPHQPVHSERLERVQHNFIRYSVRRLPWWVWPLPNGSWGALRQENCRQCALFTQDILVGRVDCADLMLSCYDLRRSLTQDGGTRGYWHFSIEQTMTGSNRSTTQ